MFQRPSIKVWLDPDHVYCAAAEYVSERTSKIGQRHGHEHSLVFDSWCSCC